MKGACVGRKAEGEAAKSRGVGGDGAVGDKAGGRWCLVRGPCDRSLDFLPLTPRQEQLPQNAVGTRWEEARRRWPREAKGEKTEAMSSWCHQRHFRP